MLLGVADTLGVDDGVLLGVADTLGVDDGVELGVLDGLELGVLDGVALGVLLGVAETLGVEDGVLDGDDTDASSDRLKSSARTVHPAWQQHHQPPFGIPYPSPSRAFKHVYKPYPNWNRVFRVVAEARYPSVIFITVEFIDFSTWFTIMGEQVIEPCHDLVGACLDM